MVWVVWLWHLCISGIILITWYLTRLLHGSLRLLGVLNNDYVTLTSAKPGTEFTGQFSYWGVLATVLLNIEHLYLSLWAFEVLLSYRGIIFQHFWEWRQLIWSWNKLREPETSWSGLQKWTGILLMLRTLRRVGCCLLIFIFNQQNTTWRKNY